MKKPLLSLGLALTLAACGQVQPQAHFDIASPSSSVSTVTESKIIGTNELVKVKKDGSNVDSNLRNYIDAFGIIDLGGGVCTGTHIGNGYVITAGHCLTNDSFGTKLNQECPNIRVLWGYRGSPETGSPKPVVNMISYCQKIVYAELSQERDFAVLKMDKAPSTFIPLSRVKSRMPQGTRLTIFGYPQGRPLEWSTYCRSIALPQNPSQFGHECDTEPGNSGSTVLTTDDYGRPSVVGIHDSGTPSMNAGTHIYDAIMTMQSKAQFNVLSATSSF